jgi:hypothetical protein
VHIDGNLQADILSILRCGRRTAMVHRVAPGRSGARAGLDHDLVIRPEPAGFGESHRVFARPTAVPTMRPALFMETSMRKIISLGIAITLAVVAAGTWAAATTRSPIAVRFSGDRINARSS